jgi:NAD(P)-dependent dehydrogenase (short-subunit alcohol dehydrogenase family)
MSANSVYSATKAALRSFARTWTTDLKQRCIRVNAVSPSPIKTPGLNDMEASTGADEQRLKMLSNSVPLGRLVHPMRSRRPWYFSHPTTAAASLQRNCLWMAAWHKYRPLIAYGSRQYHRLELRLQWRKKNGSHLATI